MNAFVFTVFLDPSYAIGAICCAQSLRNVQTRAKLVCMVTDDIPEVVREQLRMFFDEVVLVPYITGKYNRRMTDKQAFRYGTFMTKTPTKFNCLTLTQYKKIILLDADTVVVRNCDELFDMPSPAGVWSFFPIGGKTITPETDALAHGQSVPENLVLRYLQDKFICWGTSLLLEPNIDDFKALCKLVNTDFANPKCPSGLEEQAFAFHYRKQWKKLSPAYSLALFKGWEIGKHKPAIIHFYSEKPWKSERGKWQDFAIWFEIFDTVPNHRELLPNYQEIDSPKCGFCGKSHSYNECPTL